MVKAEAAVNVKEEPKKEESKPAAATKETPPVKTAASILKGRNPVMYCNDQSKTRGLHMEWEQVDCLKMTTFENPLKHLVFPSLTCILDFLRSVRLDHLMTRPMNTS